MNIYLPTLSMKADAFVVKNPLETKNNYTKTNVEDAIYTLNLANKLSLEELKGALKGYDFTSVSTNELSKIGSLLFENGLIDDVAAGFFTLGNMAFDETGHQTERDVKFNAIAMFNQMFEERLVLGKSESAGFKELTRGLVRANHVVGALSYFANSTQTDLALDIKA